MKLGETFVIPEPRDAVWRVVGDVRRVVQCLPGVEEVTMDGDDSGTVRLTQSLGPITATFHAKLHVTGREPGREIRFAATGRTIRGAAGDVRVTNAVRLEDEPGGGTRIELAADVAMGGMLGSVGAKVIARQAARAAQTFATNLEEAIGAE